MTYTFVSALLLLILIIDPFGNIPLFANTLKNIAPERRKWIIVREHLIAFAILLSFMFVGEHFLNALGLHTTSLQVAGGLILFLIAIRMIFPPPDSGDDNIEGEPLIVPLAIPLVAGPSALATVMILVSQQPEQLTSWIFALVIAVVISAIILIGADRLQKLLGSRFVVAMEKLMGLILVAVAVEMTMRGLKGYLT